jgi:eukaryotic-like serine/threonine-protein kinase
VEPGDRIGGYVLAASLGRGEAGSTWTARPAPGGAAADPAPGEVVLKVLDIGQAKDWTGYELFRREVEALKTLSHPGIPRFIASFEDVSGGDTRLVLAMERAPGLDLEAAIAGGRRFSEAEVASALAGLADILAYLGSRMPPVVHRDVNPRNVLLGPDGRVYLVDFSGAQEALRRAANPGATLIGTAGYIPLEQVSGRSSPRSDLYGAAATALFLIARRNPAELPARGLKPDLSALPPLGPALFAVLDSWLEPDEARRSVSPADAARILRGEIPPPRARPAPAGSGAAIEISVDDEPAAIALPSDSRIKIAEGEGRLSVSMPPGGLANPAALGIGGFSLFWLSFVAFWTFGAVAMGAPIFFPLFSLPFWAVGIGLARSALSSILKRTELILDPVEGIVVRERLLGPGKTRAWPLSDLGKCSVEAAAFATKGVSEKELVLEAGAKRVRMGKSLSERELRAVAARIEAWRIGLSSLPGR